GRLSVETGADRTAARSARACAGAATPRTVRGRDLAGAGAWRAAQGVARRNLVSDRRRQVRHAASRRGRPVERTIAEGDRRSVPGSLRARASRLPDPARTPA